MLNVSELTSLTFVAVPSSSFFAQAMSTNGLTTAALIARLTCTLVADESILCSVWRWAGLDLSAMFIWLRDPELLPISDLWGELPDIHCGWGCESSNHVSPDGGLRGQRKGKKVLHSFSLR